MLAPIRMRTRFLTEIFRISDSFFRRKLSFTEDVIVGILLHGYRKKKASIRLGASSEGERKQM